MIIATLSVCDRYLEMLLNIPDLTWTPGEPFKTTQFFSKRKQSPFNNYRPTQSNYTPPETFNWLEARRQCFQVQDNQNCGASQAFAAAGAFSNNKCIHAVESTFTQYSQQYLISCGEGCEETSGAEYQEKFLQKTGIPYCVSYKGRKEQCPTTCDNGNNMIMFKTHKYLSVCQNEESIKTALVMGVIHTTFDVYSDFMYYTGGIYKQTSGSLLGSIGVTLVGYGEENGIKYWIAGNTWGASWGENGYFRIARGTNECNIEQECFLQHVYL
ncbi:Cathepsin_B [Hexamita inflata]|uniref:Cathepsin B n=1 Tax=Hexamita inflata TaxID=28002 RepID=A0AA86THT8_9EUKA|nr:Cathepsin B [Hexamita inflata]